MPQSVGKKTNDKKQKEMVKSAKGERFLSDLHGFAGFRLIFADSSYNNCVNIALLLNDYRVTIA